MPGIWLGLDLGNARVGVAASNPERSFAYPEGNIRVYGDYFQVFDDVLDLIEDKGSSAKKAQRWAKSLRRRLESEMEDQDSHIGVMPDIIFIDERLTTVDAHRRLFDANVSSKQHRAVVDQQSAVEILQTALDRARDNTEEF